MGSTEDAEIGERGPCFFIGYHYEQAKVYLHSGLSQVYPEAVHALILQARSGPFIFPKQINMTKHSRIIGRETQRVFSSLYVPDFFGQIFPPNFVYKRLVFSRPQ
jgi:hypothetical protein